MWKFGIKNVRADWGKLSVETDYIRGYGVFMRTYREVMCPICKKKYMTYVYKEFVIGGKIRSH